MPTEVLHLPKLYPKQRAAIYAPERYVIIEASTKAGKTAGCIHWLITQAWETGKPGRQYWWVAPILQQAAIAFNRVKRMLTKADPKQTIWKAREKDQSIVLNNGATIMFKGSDHPDSLYGDDVYAAVCDEASRQIETAWFAVRSTLTSTRGPVRIIGNVKGRKNWVWRLGQLARQGTPNMAYFKLTAYDAVEGGIMKLEEIEDAKRVLPDNVFRELYLAEPSDDGGNPFGLDKIKACVGRMSSRDPVIFGVDLGSKQDWTVIIGLDAENAVCRFERFQTDWGLITDRVIMSTLGVPTRIDATGVGAGVVEAIQRKHNQAEGFIFTAASKQRIMGNLAVQIASGQMTIPDNEIRAELDSFEYEYKTGGRVAYSAPSGYHDDCVCALAMAMDASPVATGNIVDFRVGTYGPNATPVDQDDNDPPGMWQ